jgi:hypothetical protein
MIPYAVAAQLRVLREAADRSLVRKLTKLMASYWHAEFMTNAANYHPVQTQETVSHEGRMTGDLCFIESQLSTAPPSAS